MPLFNPLVRSYFLASMMAQKNFSGAFVNSDLITLTDNIYCSSFLNNPDAEIETNGYFIICTGDFINRGIIYCLAANGTNGTAFAGGDGGEHFSAGPLGQGLPGGLGGFDSEAGWESEPGNYWFGAYGGNGGMAGGLLGGVSRSSADLRFSGVYDWRLQQYRSPYALLNASSSDLQIGAGGGGGAAGSINAGGGGGGEGGGIILIFAQRIFNYDAIVARGGNGGYGHNDGVHATGGGGGGGGGIIMLNTNFLVPGTLTVSGGSYGYGFSGGNNGANGLTGAVYRYNLP